VGRLAAERDGLIPVSSLGTAPLRLVALGAHPDDIEIGAGGTLLRLADERRVATAHFLVFSGDADRSPEATAAGRTFLPGVKELAVEVGDARDGYFPSEYAALKDRIEAIKARSAPDVVLAPRLDDRHQDHRVVAELAWNTFRDVLILEYEIPKWEGDLGTANFYVPLTRAIAERKAHLLLTSFPTQGPRNWFTRETFSAVTRLRGVECRAPEGHAEGFTARKLVI
jgi:LmbE family N-acetylglucosaminyl deacetylase